MRRRRAALLALALTALAAATAGCVDTDPGDGGAAQDAPAAAEPPQAPAPNAPNGSNGTPAANGSPAMNGSSTEGNATAQGDAAGEAARGNATHAPLTVRVENAGEAKGNVTGALLDNGAAVERIPHTSLAPGEALTLQSAVPRHGERELRLAYEPHDFPLDAIPVAACIRGPTEGGVAVEVTLDGFAARVTSEPTGGDGGGGNATAPLLEDGEGGLRDRDPFGGC